MSPVSLFRQLRHLHKMDYSVGKLHRELKCSRYTIKTYFENNYKLDGLTRMVLEKSINQIIEKHYELRKSNKDVKNR